MKIYYKATKLDGTDFWTGTVDYATALKSERPLERKPVAAFRVCSDTVYHASSVAAETLIGGSWPCRLFEVSGRPVTQRGNKYGFRSLRVLRELPAHLALGPNGDKVVTLIKRVQKLTVDEIIRLNATRPAGMDAAFYAAFDAANCAAFDAATAAARVAAFYAAGHAANCAAFDAAAAAAFDAATADTADSAARHADDGAAYAAARVAAARVAADYAAAYAAGHAARALTVVDLITDEQFELLAGPWMSVIGDSR